jgi:hypothetical protein
MVLAIAYIAGLALTGTFSGLPEDESAAFAAVVLGGLLATALVFLAVVGAGIFILRWLAAHYRRRNYEDTPGQ